MRASICSENGVNLTLCVKENHEKLDTIILRTRRRNYSIKIENFLRHSRKINELVSILPKVVDLTCYDIGAVQTLADFFHDVNIKNIRISGHSILDSLKLSRIFDVPTLKEFISLYIIENIELCENSPSAFLFYVTIVMSDWTLICDDRVRSRFLATVAVLFPQIQNSSYLANFPLFLMLLLLGRCELNVKTELEVAFIALKWLQLNKFTLDDVRIIFLAVRSPYLSITDRQLIVEKAEKIGFMPNIIEVINDQLNSLRNSRCCIIKEHVSKEWKRCATLKNNNKYFINSYSTINVFHIMSSESNRLHNEKPMPN